MGVLTLLRDALISIVVYLQSKLPLQSSLLKDVSCLSAKWRLREWTLRTIENLAGRLPHLISQREVSLVKDQWKLYQGESIPEEQ